MTGQEPKARSGDLSLRASISIVTAAAVVATAFVVLTWPEGTSPDTTDRSATGASLTSRQDGVATPPASSSAPSPTSGPTDPAVPGADLEFPKVVGDWTLHSIDLREGLEGTFGGTGVIGYTGEERGATGTFVLVAYSGGRPVATLRAATSRANPNTTTTVSWVSADLWATDRDGYTFSAG